MTKMNPWDLVPLHLVPISSSLGAKRGPKFQAIQTAFSPPKNDRIQKIRPLLAIKLFEDEEWKWPYFLDSVIFGVENADCIAWNLGPRLAPRELEIGTKWCGTKSRVHLGHIYPLFDSLWNLKKWTPPNVDFTRVRNLWDLTAFLAKCLLKEGSMISLSFKTCLMFSI